jgi:hypothetical protein
MTTEKLSPKEWYAFRAMCHHTQLNLSYKILGGGYYCEHPNRKGKAAMGENPKCLQSRCPMRVAAMPNEKS